MVSLHASAKHGKTIYRRQQRRKRATVVRTHTRGTRQLRYARAGVGRLCRNGIAVNGVCLLLRTPERWFRSGAGQPRSGSP